MNFVQVLNDCELFAWLAFALSSSRLTIEDALAISFKSSCLRLPD